MIVGAGTKLSSPLQLRELTFFSGPAHAVYFATYEVVKQAMGGNEGTQHHPLAAGIIGMPFDIQLFLIWCSNKWSMCHNCQRRADEPL